MPPADPPAPLDPPTFDEQLRRWVLGDPVHLRTEAIDSCCPDFSCCTPELLAPPEVREAFAAASEADRMPFLMAFLGGAIGLANERRAPDRPPVNVHIAGKGPPG